MPGASNHSKHRTPRLTAQRGRLAEGKGWQIAAGAVTVVLGFGSTNLNTRARSAAGSGFLVLGSLPHADDSAPKTCSMVPDVDGAGSQK